MHLGVNSYKPTERFFILFSYTFLRSWT